MMKFRGLQIALLLLPLSAVRPQDNSRILRLHGGRVDLRCQLANNLSHGPGGRAAGLGNSITSFHPDAAMASLNPAALVRVRDPVASVDFTPPLSLDLSALIDVESEIRSSTDSAIEDYRDPQIDLQYSRLGAALQQQSQLGALLLAFPVRGTLLCTYYTRPFDLRLSSRLTAFDAQIYTTLQVSDEADDIYFNSRIDGLTRLEVGASSFGWSAARRVSPRLSFGFGMQRTRVEVGGFGRLNVDGTMLYAGRENTFNDPNDSWINTLNQSFDGRYSGAGWGWRAGVLFETRPALQLALSFDWQPEISASGAAEILNYTVPALNLDALGQEDGEDEILEAEELKLSQLTLTRAVENPVHSILTVKLPKTLRLGAAYSWKRMALHLTWVRGFDVLALCYGEDEIGLERRHSLTAGFDAGLVQLGAGYTRMNKTVSGSEKLGEQQELTLPLLSLGSHIPIVSGLDLDVLWFALPLPLLKLHFTWVF